jgi:tetratricopeptide (TPR) repeat protein
MKLFPVSRLVFMKYTRKHLVIAVSAVVVLLLVGFGIWKGFPRLFDKYAGLKLTMDVQMDDATRTLLETRIATAQASLDASMKNGEKFEMNSYLVIAENEYILGDLVKSREAYETYLKLNPISYVAHNAYATVLEVMGDYVAAELEFKTAISESPTEEYYRDYAEFLATHYPERMAEYKSVIDDAYAKLGQTVWTMLSLGDWDFAHGDCDQGVQHYAVAKTLSKDSPTIAAQIATDSAEKHAECSAK